MSEERTDRIRPRPIAQMPKEPPPPVRAQPIPPQPTGNAVSQGGATKCIYFKSQADLDQIERIVQGIPTASVSSIIQQLLSAFIQQGTAQAQAGERKIVLENVVVIL